MNKDFYDNLQKHDKAMKDWQQAKQDAQQAKERIYELTRFGNWSLVRDAVAQAENAEERQSEMLRCMVKYSARMVEAAEEEDND